VKEKNKPEFIFYNSVRIALVILFLVLVTTVVYLQVKDLDFVNYDDNEYITENLHVQAGLTFESVAWAFTTYHLGTWHPLTWLSHMLDYELFGLNPAGYHIVNLLFHITNSLLLFLILNRMTKALWQSAFVAAVFAIHPLHVESVAWASERKDVLSTLFWLLTIGAYVYYVERPRIQRYLLVILFLALGLMSKPMLVTLPFVLLLLDYWPLYRLRSEKQTGTHQKSPENPPEHYDERQKLQENYDKIPARIIKAVSTIPPWVIVRQLVLEKVPLFSLSVISCVVTYVAAEKGEHLKTLEVVPLTIRIANASVSYVGYIWKMVWPNDLAFFYPRPGRLLLWQVLGAFLLLAGITLMVIWTARKLPYLIVGWLWYVGTLAPVIGIVHISEQASADRYTYIPLIGLFIMAAWGIPELLGTWRYRKKVLVPLSAVVLLSCFGMTMIQVNYWQNSITLFDHALKVTTGNIPAYNNRAATYVNIGNYNQAIEDCDKAIELDPKYEKAYFNRARSYQKLGNYNQAIEDFSKAIELNPKFAEAYNNKGAAYGALGNYNQAIEDFSKAIELNPKYAMAYSNRGVANGKLGNHKGAIGDYDRAIEIYPKCAEAYNNRGTAYYHLGNQKQAIEDLKTAARFGNENAKNILKAHGINW